jgi:tetratricopeptide (TPR) repeat protein
MLGLILIVFLGAWTLFYNKPLDSPSVDLPSRLALRMDKLWQIAHESIRDKKYLRAEKALLTILRVDERNATAYNRLGILYAKQHAFDDAIECFEIAQSLEPSASSLHNVGLIYYETEQYTKAALAFEQALEIQNDLSARHIAYAKVQERLGDNKKMIASLERAVELEPNIQNLTILADAYERDEQFNLATKIRAKLKLIATSTNPQNIQKKITQPRRVIT